MKNPDLIRNQNRIPSSFRDPSGYLFRHEGTLYRHIAPSYQENYELLVRSGLYEKLVKDRLLIAHEEVKASNPAHRGPYKTIQPECVDFISYPYEWSFSQLKDAALATLSIQCQSLELITGSEYPNETEIDQCR